MTGDFVRDFAGQLVWLISFYTSFGFFIGLLGGVFLFTTASRYFEKKESWEIYLAPALLSIFYAVFIHWILPSLVKKHFEASINFGFFLVWFSGFGLGGLFGFQFFRSISPAIVKWKEKITKRTESERDKKTDVRTVKNLLPRTPDFYHVMQYHKDGYICVGLDKEEKPVYVPFDVWRSNHVQLTGTTGSGAYSGEVEH